uniref:ATP synthase complex subunit 8 n=2 Tax=Acestrorhamphidae TaxID=3391093 RepID=A0A890A191_9TELE|nr:ATP synthase F0 subunit 8 [Inpaichthys kerri]QQW50122.1 ATP synthase F0 subunit 8 [Inpaichthys kerri]
MPQLLPNPWFYVLLTSWLIFLIFIPSKIMKHYFSNEPEAVSSLKPGVEAWSWTWH